MAGFGEFRDRVAAVTGAASGIGRALALELAARGCHVALADVQAEALAEVRAEAEAAGVRATATRVDVTDRAAVEAWAAAVAAEHGAVHLIFNNAGVAAGATAAGMRDEDFDWVMGINVRGVVHGTQAFLPYLRQAPAAHVINISSVFGLIGVPAVTPYNVSKFAVRGYTECLATELVYERSHIGVSCVHPGGIKTAIARTARMADELEQGYIENAADARRRFERLFRTDPETAAKVILRGVTRGRRRILIGAEAYLADWLQRLFPGHYHRLIGALTRRHMAARSS